MSKGNVNPFWSDEDYIERYGLDPGLAGKPEINKAILEARRKELIETGMSEKDVDTIINEAYNDMQ